MSNNKVLRADLKNLSKKSHQKDVSIVMHIIKDVTFRTKWLMGVVVDMFGEGNSKKSFIKCLQK